MEGIPDWRQFNDLQVQHGRRTAVFQRTVVMLGPNPV
jgi:hypothetical protein